MQPTGGMNSVLANITDKQTLLLRTLKSLEMPRQKKHQHIEILFCPYTDINLALAQLYGKIELFILQRDFTWHHQVVHNAKPGLS